MRLGCLVKSWRHVSGLSTREVASQIGVSPPTINRLEKGKGVDAQTMAKIMLWLTDNEPQCLGETFGVTPTL